MTRLSDRAFADEERAMGYDGLFPPANVFGDKENLSITSEILGINERDLDISVVSGSVTIKGERAIDADPGVNFH